MAADRGPDLAVGRVTDKVGLEERARAFALDVSTVISEFVGYECPYVASMLDDRAIIQHKDSVPGQRQGVSLKADDETLLTLFVRYKCAWDSGEHYLGVEESSVILYPQGRTNAEPLFRYEFLRSPTGHLPCAHLQVHAHRDVFTHLLGRSGSGSGRSRRRQARGPMDKTPTVSEFHFPMGGPRFRPSLEDILEVTADEFGLTTGTQWPAIRKEYRAKWRRMQLAAAVRDSPEEAARVLRELDYEVTGGPQPERLAKLTML